MVGPKYYKMGKLVRYKFCDLDDFMAADSREAKILKTKKRKKGEIKNAERIAGKI
jgi:hypothetical protein